MTLDETPITLKDGRTAIIRSPREEDIPGMISYLTVSAGETDFLLRTPEECANYTYENEKKIIDDFNADDYRLMLVCVVDGKIAGNSALEFHRVNKTKHRASCAIALLKEFWNLGIGTRLFEVMIRLAQERGVLQLELDFVEGNTRARALYEKMGFRITGVRPNSIRLPNGTFLNEYSMVCDLGGGVRARKTDG